MAVVIVAAEPENVVYIRLSKRKSEWAHTYVRVSVILIRFIYKGYLLILCGEKAQLDASRRRWLV